MSEELLNAALGYAARGWPVLPIAPSGKTPLGSLVPHGLHDASTDPDIIRTWWAQEPAANIAVRTGNGFGVLDVDDYEALADAYDLCDGSTGPEVSTGRGGHLYFQTPTVTRNRVAIAPGIDWRGDGGYVIVPPSIHPSGRRYHWSQRPDKPLPELPPKLAELLAPPKAPVATSESLETQLRLDERARSNYGDVAYQRITSGLLGAPVGTRNHQLHEATIALANLIGWNAAQPSQLSDLRDIALSIGLGHTEAVRTMTSAIDFAEAHPLPSPIRGDMMIKSLSPNTNTVRAVIPTNDFHLDILDLSKPLQLAKPITPGIYLGHMTSISAEPAAGKSWLAMWMSLQVMAQDYSVLYMDAENGLPAMVSHYKLLGADPELVTSRLGVVTNPTRQWAPNDLDALDRLYDSVDAMSPKGLGLVVFDSLPNFLATSGRSEDKAEDVTWWVETVARPLQRRGAAVVWLDHLPKPSGSLGVRQTPYARGSGAKLSLVDVALRLEVVTPFNALQSGLLNLVATKDRTGTCTIPMLHAGMSADPMEIQVRVCGDQFANPDNARIYLDFRSPVERF